MRRFLSTILAALLLAATVFAAPTDGFNDGIDRNAPDFIRASIVVATAGEELFACLGHASIRMECPTFKLDYCFSYESEAPSRRLLALFAGRLKMGMFATPTDELLAEYREQGRGVWQYPLHLPPAVKQRLWKILDDWAARGPSLPYDYLKRGCARASYDFLDEAWRGCEVRVGPWNASRQKTRRERVGESLEEHPWTRFAMHALVGANLEWDEPLTNRIVLPDDLVERLSGVTVDGQPVVLVHERQDLLPCRVRPVRPWFSPVVASILFLLLCLANLFVRRSCGDWLVLALQSSLGAVLTYLLLFSSLPATSWNWLLVPFNLLPLVFWRWCRRWAFGYAIVLAVWEIGMLASPHRLTDPAYLWIVLGLIVFYLKFASLKFLPHPKKVGSK